MSWIILTLLSAFCTSIKEIISKNLFKKDVSPKQMLFEEYFLMLLIVFLLFFTKINFSSIQTYWHLFIIKATTLALSSIIYLNLLKKNDISIIAPLMNLSPVFLIFLSIIFLNEYLTTIQVIGILITIFAIYLLEITTKNHHHKEPHSFHFKNLKKLNWKFFLATFIMLLSISFTAIFDKTIFNSNISVYTNIYFTSLIIFLTLIFYYLKEKHLKLALKNIVTQPQTLIISLFSVLSTFFVLYALAIPTAMVSLVIPLKRTSTLMSAVFGGILFHENHLMKKSLATSMMLVGVLLILI